MAAAPGTGTPWGWSPHRAFATASDMFAEVTTNAGGLVLHFRDTEAMAPVAHANSGIHLSWAAGMALSQAVRDTILDTFPIDEAQKRKSGREFRWGAAIARRTLEQEELDLRDLERESDKARARRLRKLQFEWLFSARCGELDALLAVEVERQALADQEIADLERLGAHQQAELAKRREDALFSERLGELDALISELEADMSFVQGQRDALYFSEEAVEIDHDTKRGDFLAESLAYEEAKRFKREVARLRHAQKKRGYYGMNDEGWLVACGKAQPEEDKEVRLSTYNKFDVLEHQPAHDSDEEAEVPKKTKDKRRRKVHRAPKEVDNFDELLAEAATWDAECQKLGAPLKPSRAAYHALAQKRVNSFGIRSEETDDPIFCRARGGETWGSLLGHIYDDLEDWRREADRRNGLTGNIAIWLTGNDVYNRRSGLASFTNEKLEEVGDTAAAVWSKLRGAGPVFVLGPLPRPDGKVAGTLWSHTAAFHPSADRWQLAAPHTPPRGVLQHCDEVGEYDNLVQELRLNDPQGHLQYFRVNKGVFDLLQARIEDQITRSTTTFRQPVSAPQRLSVTLRYLASGAEFSALAPSYRLGESTTRAAA
ncbi:hypothetical protein FJT64_015821 [Amphibalanus amphitrite]|uniref:Uncharacterized protein n=1 Tax=Amphibalanus amphitrite TaxID=1232801 RepID=A0A6A4X1Y1_AMPAM|nr:hypothetical protein FJT64_015821 [Amphibalanus amphitrite]